MAKEPTEADDGWHPRRTAVLTGHQRVEAALRQALDSGRMPHAWLLTGPQGIGKATLAYRVARYLLDRGRPTDSTGLFGGAAAASNFDVEPQSGTFRTVAGGVHPNLLVVERTLDEKTKRLRSEIGVDEVRRLIPFFGSTVADGGWRVAIVDAADELNRQAANALLKSLEEPPSRGLLVLIAHAPGAVLPTIRSRCATMALAPLTDGEVRSVLAARVAEATEDEIEGLVRLAQGRPGRGIGLWRAGGLDTYRELMQLMGSMPGRLDLAKVHGLGDRLNRRGNEEQYRLVMDLLLDWLSAMITSGAGRKPVRTVVDGERQVVEGLWRSRNLAQWLEVWEKVRNLVVSGEALNLDRKQILIDVFLNLDGAAQA